MTMLECYHFSATPILREIAILGNSNSPKMLILTILEVLNFDFSKFEQLSSPKFAKIQSSEFPKLPKMAFLDCFDTPKFDFT